MSKEDKFPIEIIICLAIIAAVIVTTQRSTEKEILSGENRIYDEIYSKAYKDGQSSAISENHNAELDEARENIYQAGYEAGYSECETKLRPDISNSYNKGYDAGYADASYIKGFEDLEEAYLSGSEDGYIEGHNDGYDEGHSEGYREGYDEYKYNHDCD